MDIKQSKVIRQVVDGQQRLRTILSFIDIESLPRADEWDKFTVSKSHNERYYGLPFDQLPEDVQTRILQTPLSVNVLPANVNDVTVLQIFQRMNSTGLKLNPQELRNATYFGEFKDLSYSLAYDQLHRWLAWDLFDRQKIGQMLEVEFTADLMGLLLKGVFARTKSAIDGLYRDYEQSLPAAHEITQQFNAAFDFLDHVFSPGRVKSSLRRFRSTAWVYSCFAVATGADYFDLTSNPRKEAINAPRWPNSPEHLTKMLDDAELALRDESTLGPVTAKVLRGATSDRRSREQRINFLRSFL